jgi:hypothetical protein
VFFGFPFGFLTEAALWEGKVPHSVWEMLAKGLRDNGGGGKRWEREQQIPVRE